MFVKYNKLGLESVEYLREHRWDTVLRDSESVASVSIRIISGVYSHGYDGIYPVSGRISYTVSDFWNSTKANIRSIP